MTTADKVVTRFPPSPTGYLHIGRARTALFNYLFTQKNKGKMVFRLEDTDKERSKKEYEDNIIDCLKWLGISYDEGPIRQSERNEVYKTYLKKLIDSGYAYISKEELTEEDKKNSENQKEKRAEVIRFKNPNKKITFTDLIRGDIEFDTTDLGDFVIARSLEEPLYHLAVVIDDFEMNVTHVIRGEDGISNTPRQILIQEGIGAPRPFYAHIPLILAADKSKLSGRHGAVAVTDYRTKGYLPEAIVNYLALLGWNPGTDQEIFSLSELIDLFDLSKVQKSGAVFNIEKLNWFNKEYIKKLPKEKIHEEIRKRLAQKYAATPEIVEKLTPIIIERITVFSDIDDMIALGELEYFFAQPMYKPEQLLWKGKGELSAAKTHLRQVTILLEKVSDSDFTKDTVKAAIWDYAEKEGRGNVLWPMRVALSGREKSPDPFVLAELLGKEVTLERLTHAQQL